MEFAMRNDVQVPENWLRVSTARQEWLIGFMCHQAQLELYGYQKQQD